MLVIIRGAGDLASGIACRLFRAGMQVILTETPNPLTVRCTVSFSPAVYQGKQTVEDIEGFLAHSAAEAKQIAESGKIAVLVDPAASCVQELHPDALVDAILAKRNIGTKLTDAPVVIGIGPGFTPGLDCTAAVETQRGHYLGRVLTDRCPAANTGIPGNIGGYTVERIIRASDDGIWHPVHKIGDLVKAGDLLAHVENAAGQLVPVTALIDGAVRGMLPEGTPVTKGLKSGDVDPRGHIEYCQTVSDKSSAIAGGVLEAVLRFSGALQNR